MQEIFTNIAAIGRSLGAEKIVLFGSRARGDARERSDVDIAIFGLPKAQRNNFIDSVDNIPTLLDFDIVFISPDTSPELLCNIQKDGVILMDKSADKLAKLQEAVARLKEGAAAYSAAPSDVIRDGVIQRFEFCTELAWKATREYLLDQGYTEINSPKSVMRKAYADNLIADEQAWLSLLNDRNTTSHIYDDAAAQEIFQHIKTSYIELFADLIDRLSE